MSIRDNLDISAYLVLGPENTLDRPVPDIVAEAVRAGFTCIQLRSKTASARQLISCARETARVIQDAGASERGGRRSRGPIRYSRGRLPQIRG